MEKEEVGPDSFDEVVRQSGWYGSRTLTTVRDCTDVDDRYWIDQPCRFYRDGN